jgi:hypothetical protein
LDVKVFQVLGRTFIPKLVLMYVFKMVVPQDEPLVPNESG